MAMVHKHNQFQYYNQSYDVAIEMLNSPEYPLQGINIYSFIHEGFERKLFSNTSDGVI